MRDEMRYNAARYGACERKSPSVQDLGIFSDDSFTDYCLYLQITERT